MKAAPTAINPTSAETAKTNDEVSVPKVIKTAKRILLGLRRTWYVIPAPVLRMLLCCFSFVVTCVSVYCVYRVTLHTPHLLRARFTRDLQNIATPLPTTTAAVVSPLIATLVDSSASISLRLLSCGTVRSAP